MYADSLHVKSFYFEGFWEDFISFFFFPPPRTLLIICFHLKHGSFHVRVNPRVLNSQTHLKMNQDWPWRFESECIFVTHLCAYFLHSTIWVIFFYLFFLYHGGFPASKTFNSVRDKSLDHFIIYIFGPNSLTCSLQLLFYFFRHILTQHGSTFWNYCLIVFRIIISICHNHCLA